jgi:hypothetical protein
MSLNSRCSQFVVVWLLCAPLTACRGREQPKGSIVQIQSTSPSQPKSRLGEPRIHFDARTYDFGLVNEGSPLMYVFQIGNIGTAPLLLSDVRTSCGCTAATMGASTVLPGDTAPFEVTVDTHGERGPSQRDIMLSSNDPREPTSTLTVSYEVQRLLDLGGSFVFLRTTLGRRRTERVWLTGQLARQASLRVVRIEGNPLVTARLIKARHGGQLRSGIQLGLQSKSPVSGDAVITIQTGLSNPSELSLRVGYSVD